MRRFTFVVVVLAVLGLPGIAAADHPARPVTQNAPLSSAVNSGGQGARWSLVTSIPTGNPHTDLDFFTQKGELYASVGTLAIGPNAGGQTIVKLVDASGAVKPTVVSSAPTAACISNPAAALGLQHDVEATPKGDVLLNTEWADAVTADAQLLVDATDARGRCHDQGTLGLQSAPRGGLEIIDITDVTKPVEIGLTSHIGEAHTVNVDPRRPHIVYAVTSDSLGTNADGKRTNEDPSGAPLALDGWEVVDISSCMNFPAGTSVEQKREACRPEVYRYRFPSATTVLGHTLKTGTGNIGACHELEVYPDDRLTCASLSSTALFDMSAAFDDNGTPDDYTDDRPRGTPLPCNVRASTSAGPFATGAMVTDCVVGKDKADLTVPGWLQLGAPSLEGVEHLGTAYHQGLRGSDYPSTEDVSISHEAELTSSGKFMIVSDERGGGVLPPGATCAPGVDNPAGNGGLHAYAVDRLLPTSPATAEEAWTSYASTPEGDKAIFRAPIHTTPEPTVCTSHVFQQIPGQNRIFMGWYSQGTQVVDYIEHPDGTFEWKSAGYFIPENANTWVSHVFKVEDNKDGTFTYYGATGDFNLGTAGRNAIDIYKVVLPAPPGIEVPEVDRVARVSGSTRMETAIALSQLGWESADNVLLARVDDFADALTAASLAAEIDAPVLLTPSDHLDVKVGDELNRLGAQRVYLMGGRAALSEDIERELERRNLAHTRIGGPTRFETAALVAEELVRVGGDLDQAIVSLGLRPDGGAAWQDAVAAGNLAAAGRAPVLLTLPDRVPETTRKALAELLERGDPVFITGGQSAVGPTAEAELRAEGYDTRRLAGPDRYGTAVAVAREAQAQGGGIEPAILASGEIFADALVAGPVAAKLGGVMLLVHPQDVEQSPATRDYLAENAAEIDTAYLAGGTSTLSPEVEEQVRELIADPE